MACLTLLVSKKFFSSHWSSKFFLGGFVRIISFKQSNQHTHVTRTLHFRIQNVTQWWFLSFETKIQPGSVKISSKREFWKMASLTLLVSKKFFSSHWNSKFFREGFVRIISFKQSNQHTHTTRSLHFRNQNVIQWWFLSLETQKSTVRTGWKSAKYTTFGDEKNLFQPLKNFLRIKYLHCGYL